MCCENGLKDKQSRLVTDCNIARPLKSSCCFLFLFAL